MFENAPLNSPQQNPAYAPSSAHPRQGIVLRSGYFRLDWTLRFTRTIVTIDGKSSELPWGQHFFPLEPGPHQLQVSYPYLGATRGKASASVDVSPREVARVVYRAPSSVLVSFLPGKLTVEPPIPA